MGSLSVTFCAPALETGMGYHEKRGASTCMPEFKGDAIEGAKHQTGDYNIMVSDRTDMTEFGNDHAYSRIYRGGDVSTCLEVVLKFSFDNDDSTRMLQDEAKFYAQELYELQGHIIPKSYGIYRGEAPKFMGGGQVVCLVLEYSGRALDTDVYDLGHAQKLELLQLYVKIHEAGLEYGEVDRRHVLQHQGAFRIIDFHRAMKHQPGCKFDIPHDLAIPLNSRGLCPRLFNLAHYLQIWKSPKETTFCFPGDRTFSCPLDNFPTQDVINTLAPKDVKYWTMKAMQTFVKVLLEKRDEIKPDLLHDVAVKKAVGERFLQKLKEEASTEDWERCMGCDGIQP